MPDTTNIKQNLSEQDKVQLGYRIRDLRYKKEYSALKVKIALNCFELLALFIVLFLGLFLLLNLIDWRNISMPLGFSCIISLFFVGLFYKYKKYQISITRFDKEDIYKKISKDLLDSKC